MIQPRSLAEIKRNQELDALVREQYNKDFVPEPNKYKPMACFEISRYTQGQFIGLFVVAQLITEDSKGKTLKKPLKKIIAEGVDMVVAMSSLETALRRRVYR